MPPRKRRKSAPKPSWRDTLFYWRGELCVNDSHTEHGCLLWTGTWVGSDDGVLPTSEQFAQSENTFTLHHKCDEDEPSWEMFEPDAGDLDDNGEYCGDLTRDCPYVPSELTFEGFYLLDNGDGLEETADDKHTAAYDPRKVERDGAYEMTNHLVTACGATPFGRFISHGRIVVRDGEASYDEILDPRF